MFALALQKCEHEKKGPLQKVQKKVGIKALQLERLFLETWEAPSYNVYNADATSSASGEREIRHTHHRLQGRAFPAFY